MHVAKYNSCRGFRYGRQMARNVERRQLLADAGLNVLADAGARGLTHRAVDAEADVPTGTCSNYFRSREQLLNGLAKRVLERIAPAEDRLQELATPNPSIDVMVDYIRYIVERTLGAPQLTLALFELRIEACRNPSLAEVLGSTLATAYREDVAFNTGRGLPGGPFEIALLHFAIDGLLLDKLTTSFDPDLDVDVVVDALVTRLVPTDSGAVTFS